MEMKDLVRIINIYDAKIIFDSPQNIVEKLMTGDFLLYFTPVDGKELSQYKKMKDKRDFVSTTAAIHIIDLDVEKIMNIFECDGSGLHEYTRNIVRPYCNGEIDEGVVYMMFLFLHEIGHWIQFQNMGRKVFAFERKDEELKKENAEKMFSLIQEREKRMKKGNQCSLTAKEKNLLNQYMNEYRNIPMEKEADEFALSQIKLCLDLYKKSQV